MGLARGHNVTNVNGSNLYPQVPERVGIQFVSAGYDGLLSLRRYMQQCRMAGLICHSAVKFNRLGFRHHIAIQIRAKVEEIGVVRFQHFLLLHEKGRRCVVFSTLMTILPSILPQWPIPLPSSGQSDDLSFLESF